VKNIAIIPAGGSGMRMNTEKPKQYLKLDSGFTILDTTISRLLITSFFDMLIIVISNSDYHYWKNSIHFRNHRIKLTYGGMERSDSVRKALISIKNVVQDEDWIFVHDASRVCICFNDIERLYKVVTSSKKKVIGGILATKATDTVKQINGEMSIIRTLAREETYLAQTPQVFRFGALLKAYLFCFDRNINITDEASAIEISEGKKPVIVKGSHKNIKITRPEDLVIANYFLSTL
jgi:2-C-methyl-D-erythritol 4-phosphate cytidylyltransferase